MRSLVTRTPMQTGYGGVRHVAVSLAHVPALVDGVKYMEPPDVPRLEGSQLRRAPPLRFLVKLAVRYESAKELGKRLRRRYQRQLQRGAMSRQEGSPSIFREIRHGSRRKRPPGGGPNSQSCDGGSVFPYIANGVRQAINKARYPTFLINRRFYDQLHLLIVCQGNEGRCYLLLINNHWAVPSL